MADKEIVRDIVVVRVMLVVALKVCDCEPDDVTCRVAVPNDSVGVVSTLTVGVRRLDTVFVDDIVSVSVAVSVVSEVADTIVVDCVTLALPAAVATVTECVAVGVSDSEGLCDACSGEAL